MVDFRLTSPPLPPSFPPILPLRRLQGLVPEIAGFQSLSKLAANVWCVKSDASCFEEGMPPEELQDWLWQQFFSDQTQWWDNRWNKTTPGHPDFRHKRSKVALWLTNRHKPAWVDSQLATWDCGMTRPPESVSNSVKGQGRIEAHEGRVTVGMCRKACAEGSITDAVKSLNLLVQQGCHVPNNLFYLVLKKCKDLALGRRIHALTVQGGYDGDAFLATHLIGLYASHGRLEEAMQVFTNVSTPSSYNWASIISAFARHGEAAQAVCLYQQMREAATVKPDNRIYLAALKACATARDLVAGKEIHAHILASPGKANLFVQTGLVSMYASCGSLENAQKVFDRLPARDMVTWTAMIAGYTQQGMAQKALILYNSMQLEDLTPPDCVTFTCLLQACASVGVGALHQAKQLHAQIEERGLQHDVVLGGSLVNVYANCGRAEDARRVFDGLPEKSVVTWTAMIAGYCQQGMCQEALRLYSSMLQEGLTPPNSVTFVCLLQACAKVGVGALQQGKQLHAQIEERGLQCEVVLGTCLIDMYVKCGALDHARSMFDRLPDRDVVTWNVMLAGYAQQGMGQEALNVYSTMHQMAITPNSVTFVCLLQVCASLAALPLGKQLHAQIKERGLVADGVVGAALVHMYAKCGTMFESQQVFDSLPERSGDAWSALIAGYARHGDSEVVFDLVDSMRYEGIQPNSLTCLSVLTVCSHVGLVDKSRKYFDAMRTDYGITPTVEHYTCMINVLGRAGRLEEALHMAKTIPFPPDSAVWLTLLGACQIWKNVEIGQQAFEFAVSMDGKDAASYVLMSNIYASAQMWQEAKEMQARRVKSGAWKTPGQSWATDVGGVLQKFVVGDKKHSESEGSYALLEQP